MTDREKLKQLYGSTIKGKPINKMSDGQVAAIALRLRAAGKLK